MGKKLRNKYDFKWETMDKTCKKICIAFVLFIATLITLLFISINQDKNGTETVLTTTTDAAEAVTYNDEPIKPVYVGKPAVTQEPDDIPKATVTEIALIAMVTMAEAEGESEEGKRLVIDTILNRVDSDYWPDTIEEVIYQPGQFSSMWNGRINKCYVTDEIRELVIEELANRTNYDVVYFTAGAYGQYGKPMFQVGNHYFASID